MAATLMVADLVLRGGGPRDVALAGATATPGSGRREKNSSRARKARSSVSGLLAQRLRRKTSRTEVRGSNPAGDRIRSRPLLSSSGELELWVDSLAVHGVNNGRGAQKRAHIEKARPNYKLEKKTE